MASFVAGVTSGDHPANKYAYLPEASDLDGSSGLKSATAVPHSTLFVVSVPSATQMIVMRLDSIVNVPGVTVTA